MTTKHLIVGLGNKGKIYRNNRHNIGFMLVDYLTKDMGISLSRVQSRAIVGSGTWNGHSLIFAKPQTYMNASGDSVGPLAKYYKLPLENILVVYDELDLPLGTLRLRKKGRAGGHNGMKSVISHLGQEFSRLRLGIDRPPGRMPVAAYVLQNFNKKEQELVDVVLREGADAVKTWLDEGIELAMTRHNGVVN